ncbi:hypothetical protein G4G28_19280 [Massilia sp. Dwa41.01b]|uniref:hypothetical protein n=1 Tax=unclassified Massilia TaxID=2609279 RepID=UPI0016048BAA|nr:MULTISPECIES: hypothetical protein [unclassified Massilia]QNA90101.1 hypothetical protein G4G28_19280 [Massilia sp. Dwa41.01b]QNB00991.1 hypothetical protein G4G31_22885 [Massilia sp. Se16.2.3]
MQRRPFLLAAVAAASFITACASTAGEPTVDVKHSIDIATPPGKVLVNLTITNQGKATVWIPREIALEKELTGRRFDVRDFGNRPIDYTGKMVKRAALTAADYEPLAPGKVLKNTIDITRTYAFQSGRHSYNIGYAGPVLVDPKRLDALTEFPAKPVSFVHTGQ